MSDECAVCRRQTYARDHTARGLCNPCYGRARHDGTLADYPRTTYASAEVLEEWEVLRRSGVGLREAATRLGMTLVALDRALHRAMARGDSRAAHQCMRKTS